MKFLLSLFIVFIFSSYAYSQPTAEEKLSLNYIPATYKNINRILWRYNLHDVKNNEIVDDYLRITYCDLYKKYYKDDFKWQGIRQGFRRDVEYFSDEYSNRFYINATIPINRYDFEKSAFEITDKYALYNGGAIQFPFYQNEYKFCEIPGFSIFFPINVKFKPDNSFELTHIPVEPEQADKILENIKQYKYENRQDMRILPIRFRVKINGIHDYKTDLNAAQVILSGDMDEIAVFEDPEMKKLIWKKQFKILQD